MLPEVSGILAAIVLLISTLGFSASSFAHALQPGYLELRLIDKNLLRSSGRCRRTLGVRW